MDATTMLLVFYLLGPAPVNSSGEVTGPSPQLGVFSVPYADLDSCETARSKATVSWTDALDVKGVLRVCQAPAAL